MELKFFHHIGIAPAVQMRALGRAQPLRAAAGAVSLGQWRAERVELGDQCGRQRAERIGIAQRRQRQKAADPAQLQPLKGDRRQAGGQSLNRRPQARLIAPRGQSEGRLQRRVQPVFARCFGQLCHGARQAGQIGMRAGPSRHRVPAEPGCAEIRQGACFGREIEREALEKGHDRAFLGFSCFACSLSHGGDSFLPKPRFSGGLPQDLLRHPRGRRAEIQGWNDV